MALPAGAPLLAALATLVSSKARGLFVGENSNDPKVAEAIKYAKALAEDGADDRKIWNHTWENYGYGVAQMADGTWVAETPTDDIARREDTREGRLQHTGDGMHDYYFGSPLRHIIDQVMDPERVNTPSADPLGEHYTSRAQELYPDLNRVQFSSRPEAEGGNSNAMITPSVESQVKHGPYLSDIPLSELLTDNVHLQVYNRPRDRNELLEQRKGVGYKMDLAHQDTMAHELQHLINMLEEPNGWSSLAFDDQDKWRAVANKRGYAHGEPLPGYYTRMTEILGHLAGTRAELSPKERRRTLPGDEDGYGAYNMHGVDPLSRALFDEYEPPADYSSRVYGNDRPNPRVRKRSNR